MCCAYSSWSFDILLTVEVIILLQQLYFWFFFLPLEAGLPNVGGYCPLPAPWSSGSDAEILRWAPVDTSEGSLLLSIQHVHSWSQRQSTPSCSGRIDSQPPGPSIPPARGLSSYSVQANQSRNGIIYLILLLSSVLILSSMYFYDY